MKLEPFFSQCNSAKIGTKSWVQGWQDWRFFSNSEVIKSHSQPIRIEHQLSLNWSRNSITKKKWRRRLGITSENYLLWYPSMILDVHSVWKLQKKSHSTLRAKRATFKTKVYQKCQKWSVLASFLKPVNNATRQVIFNRTKIDGKCQNSKSTFWVLFKQ